MLGVGLRSAEQLVTGVSEGRVASGVVAVDAGALTLGAFPVGSAASSAVARELRAAIVVRSSPFSAAERPGSTGLAAVSSFPGAGTTAAVWDSDRSADWEGIDGSFGRQAQLGRSVQARRGDAPALRRNDAGRARCSCQGPEQHR